VTHALAAAALACVVLIVAGAFRTVRGPSGHDRVLAVQFVSTVGVGLALIAAFWLGARVLLDLALLLALTAAVVSMAFVSGAAPPAGDDE